MQICLMKKVILNSLIMHKNLLFIVHMYGTKCNECIVDGVDTR